MKRSLAVVVTLVSIAGCSPSAPAPAAEVSPPVAAAPASAPPVVNKDIFVGAFANSQIEGVGATVAATPDGVSYSAEREDSLVLITPATPIDPAVVKKVIITFKKVDVTTGEYSLFYRSAERDFDGTHFSYASGWEDISPTDVRLTYDFTATAGWSTAPVTQLRFDPVSGATGRIVLTSVEGAS